MFIFHTLKVRARAAQGSASLSVAAAVLRGRVRARPVTGPTVEIIVGPVGQAERLSVARRPLSAARAGVGSSPRIALVSVRVCCCTARGQCLAACRCGGAAGAGARTSGHRTCCRGCCGAGRAGRAPVCRAPAAVCGTRCRQPSLASPPLVSVRVCCCVSACCLARSAPLLWTWSFTVPCDERGHEGSGVSLRCREVSMGAAEVACPALPCD